MSATLLLAGLLIAFLPAGSGAEEPLITGWWQRDIPLTGQSGATAVIAQIASSPRQIPPPPTVPPVPVTVPPDVTIPDPGQDAPLPDPTPSGGLMVANDPTGPRAMAALRFDAPTAAGGIVTLQVTDGSTPAPAIRACPSLSDWQAGPNQAWSRRPAHDCGRVAVASTVAADGTVTFDLPDDFRDPDAAFFDVILVPAEGDGTPFQTVFAKPGADAFEVTSTLVPEEEYDPGDFDVDIGSGFDDAFGTDGFAYTGGDGYSFDSPTATTAIQPTANDRATGTDGTLRRIAGVLENPTSRRIAALALIVIGGYAYWQSGQAVQRAPQLLGSLGGSGPVPTLARVVSPPRGIGRFNRVRIERPPRL
ncbi:MAG: hypothetical protein ACT452_07220 [Microthrixaceae bacterium]